jgi:PAS domain S-box-containing protein
MNDEPFLGLIQNASLLLAVAFIFDLAASRWQTEQASFRKALVGLALGFIGITVMLTPWNFGQGIVFDTRSVLLGISGLFFGWVPAAIAMAMTAAYRFYQGGTGAWTGVAVILASGTIGIAWRHFRLRSLADLSWRELYLFGIVIHLAMLGLMLTLPGGAALRVLSNIGLPVILIYPLGTALLGALMVNRLRRERVDEALQKERDLLGRITETSPVGITFVNRDGQIVFANQRAEQILGLTKDQITHHSYNAPIWNITTESGHPFPEDELPFQRVMKTAKPVFDLRHAIEWPEGTRVYLSINAAPLLDVGGRADGMVATLEDITDRKRVEEELRERDIRFRKLSSHVPGMIYQFMKKPDGTYCLPFTTEAIRDIFDCSPEEVREDLSAITRVIYPGDLDEFRGSIESSAESMTDWQCEYRVQIPGRPIRWMFGHSTPEKLSDGGIIWHGFNTDITDRRQMEETLRESEERYRRIADNVADVVWVSDLNLNITYVSPSVERMVGESVDAHVKRAIEEKLPPDSLNQISLLFLEELEKEKDPRSDKDRTRLIEVEHYRADGTTLWVAMNVSFVRDENGNAVGFQGVTRDITDRRQAAEELRQSFVRIRKALGATVQAMAVTVETRDPYTAGHQHRVADLARSIATEMNLTGEQIDGIRTAAVIHDLGKISVPAEILSKPTKLTDIEFSLIKTHAQSGYDILKDIDFPWPVARMVLEHHERMDGSGYPNGLTGDKLLLESRILAVADVVEAMASHRPYRPSVGLDAALEEITRNKGVLYDADAVEACLKLFHERHYQFTN